MIPTALAYTINKAVLIATLDAIFEKREFHFHGSREAVNKFKDRLSATYVWNYKPGEELQWPASMCT